MKGSLCSKVLVLFFVCVSLVFIVSCSGGVSGINSGTDDGMNFDITDAKSFFAGKASSISANRAVRESDNNSEILLKINNKGEIEPAVTLKDNVSFDLKKIFKNPVKRELILTGRFSKWGPIPNWSYSILRVSEDGIWYGLNLENYQFFDYISEPFDMNGNFYFQANKWENDKWIYEIFKYSDGKAEKLVSGGELAKVLQNGSILFTKTTGTYLMTPEGASYKLTSDSSIYNNQNIYGDFYVPSLDVYYFSQRFISDGNSNLYETDDGSLYYLVSESNNEYKVYKINGNNVLEYLGFCTSPFNGSSEYLNGKYYYKISLKDSGEVISVFHKQESGEGYFILDYFDFKDCKIKSVGKKVLTSIYSINGWYEYDYKRLASADFEGVFDDSVITKDVIKYKINSDKSLEIEYNLLNQGSRGYSVATNMPNSGYSPYKDYFVKILDKGTTIYFAGDEGTSWSTSYSKNLYKIKNFGQPEKIALNDKYAFTSGIVFADNGDISAVVTRDSDGADGLLTGNMEAGEFDFKADEVFGSVTEIVLNF